MLSGGPTAGIALASVAPLDLIPSDPVFLGMLALILLFFFFLFLMVRRTVTAFNEGVERRK